MIRPFVFSGVPRILFGPGEFGRLDRITKERGNPVLVVTGAASLERSGKWDELAESLEKASIRYDRVQMEGEPSPDFVDRVVSRFREKGIQVVLAVGGGSVVDAGKAISAMIPQDTSVYDYLEGIGDKHHNGEKLPFVAVPTTSGTGSEATKNAVLSKVGEHGFKKSIRHDRLVPDVAVIDPELMVPCPPHISAACGMDAFTQLLESYVSTQASPFTDALAYSGISHVKDNLIPVCTTEGANVEKRTSMAYASLVSGITLANAGLGVVHGLASPIGAFFTIPHGVVCGTLLGAEVRVNIEKLRQREGGDSVALRKYAKLGGLVSGRDPGKGYVDLGCDLLVETIDEWIEALKIARLSEYGIRASDLDRIARSAGNKNNPVELMESEIIDLLSMRL
jgi:alcohol dehydrogenase class IV